jgi:hypothetical protein
MISGREHQLTYIELESLLIQEDSVRTRNRDRENEDEAAIILHQDSVMFTSTFNNRGGRGYSNYRGGSRGHTINRSRPFNIGRSTSYPPSTYQV